MGCAAGRPSPGIGRAAAEDIGTTACGVCRLGFGEAMRSGFRLDRQSRISSVSTLHGLDAGGQSDSFHLVFCTYSSCRC